MISTVRVPAPSQVVLDSMLQSLVFMLVAPLEDMDTSERRTALVVARQAGRAAGEITHCKITSLDWLLYVVAPAVDAGGAHFADVKRWRSALLGKKAGRVDSRVVAFMAGAAETRSEAATAEQSVCMRVGPIKAPRSRPLRVRRLRRARRR